MARVLVHVADDRRVVADPDRISHARVHGEVSRVFVPGSEPLDDTRKLGALAATWKAHGFVRVHDDCLVNPTWVRELRRAAGGDRRWQLVLNDAEGTAIEVERDHMAGIWSAFGER